MTAYAKRSLFSLLLLTTACAKNHSLGARNDGGIDVAEHELSLDAPSDQPVGVDQNNDIEMLEASSDESPDAFTSADQGDDMASVDGDAGLSVVPQCAGREAGDNFCVGSDVYQCGPNLTTMTLFMACIAPKPACMSGQCGTCVTNATRSCTEDGLVGPCAKGTETCGGNGTWGRCSIPPAAADTCAAGNDDNCNGKPNEGCVPQCMGRQVGDKFCMGSDVYQCGGNLMSMTLVTTCAAPTPACMGGTCGTCLPSTTRSCSEDGLRGPCAQGTETCSGTGTWGPCSVSPKLTDTCEPANDDNCNGKPNENCTCVNGDQKTCMAALNKQGTCGLDTATCVNGQWTGCADSKGTDTCVRGNDNSCNGKTNEGCTCINGDTGTCGDKLGHKGYCAGGTTTCAGGQWGACDRVPKATDLCVFGNDDMCVGVPVGNPGNLQCQCGGFPMPNPPSTGLPNPASYTINGNGTVTDNVTGLVWDRAVSSGTQISALGICAAKGSEWHLPSRIELLSLVDFSAGIGPTINSAFPNTPGSPFWTSSPAYGDSNSAWYVNFFAGDDDRAPKTNMAAIRCVSVAGSPRCYPSRYQIKTAGEVFDAATGLTWEKVPSATSYDWAGASAHCAAGWRLPSFSELQSIVDETTVNPATNAIFPTQGKYYWTSSPVGGDVNSGEAWAVNFFYGTTDSGSDYSDTTNSYLVRCVR